MQGVQAIFNLSQTFSRFLFHVLSPLSMFAVLLTVSLSHFPSEIRHLVPEKYIIIETLGIFAWHMASGSKSPVNKEFISQELKEVFGELLSFRTFRHIFKTIIL